MKEITTPASLNTETPGNAVYETNVCLYESLEVEKAKAEKYTKRERFWARNGAYISLAPLIAAGAILISPLDKKMDYREKVGTEAYGLIGSIFVGMAALSRHDKNRKKAQELAKSALPLAHALNNRTPIWIEQRLNQKEKDRLRAEGNL